MVLFYLKKNMQIRAYINVDYHFIRDRVTRKLLGIRFIPSKDQWMMALQSHLLTRQSENYANESI
jgi:hypothetical protein